MQVKIEKLDDQFRGISHVDGKVLFVPRVIPGEVCEVEIIKDKKNYMEGRLREIVLPSEKRVVPKCPYYDSCGGCDLEHISYLESVLWKKKMLHELFSKHNLWHEDILVVASEKEFGYRNKVTLKVQEGKLGFYYPLTHELVEISKCLITEEAINRVIQDFSMFAFLDGELMIRVNENEEILMDIMTNDEVKIEADFARRHKIAGILVNHKCVYGKSHFFERKEGVLYQVSYDSFFQVNPNVSSEMFLYVRKCLKNARNILDLYCGVGTLGFQTYQSGVSITGIELVQNAIINAIRNAKLNHIPANFHLGKVENIISKIDTNFDAVIIDPPRAGMDDLTIKAIKKISPEILLYISCNPQTLVRDLKLLGDCYEIKSVQGFDMFPYTKHVECVTLLVSKKR